jgi:hypothetical protein
MKYTPDEKIMFKIANELWQKTDNLTLKQKVLQLRSEAQSLLRDAETYNTVGIEYYNTLIRTDFAVFYTELQKMIEEGKLTEKEADNAHLSIRAYLNNKFDKALKILEQKYRQPQAQNCERP